jgi:tetratricopeptide (TPR) repeat protein
MLSLTRADHFLSVVDESAPAIRSGASEQALTRLNHEYDNIRGALQWCRDHGQGSETGTRLVAGLWMYWIRRGMVREGLSWVHALLPGTQKSPVAVRAGALCAAGTLSWIHGENDAARAWLEESVALWRTTGDPVGLGRAMYYLGSLRLEVGELGKAGRLILQSAELFRASNSFWDLAVALCGLGKVATKKRDLAKAVALYEQATLILRAIPDPWILSFSLRHLAALASSQHDDAAAEAYWRECLVLSRSIDAQIEVLHGLEGFAALHLKRGDYPRVARLLGAASSLRRNLHSSLPNIQLEHSEDESTKLHRAMGKDKVNVLWTEGESLSCDEAIALALAGASETSGAPVRRDRSFAMKALKSTAAKRPAQAIVPSGD